MSTVVAEESEAEAAGIAPPAEAGEGRFARNFIASLLNFVVNVVTGIWFVPFLIRHLGEAAYGLVPLATQMTAYMAVITLGLNSAVGRFITIALKRGDDETASKVFNTSLFGSLGLVAILLGPSVWIALHVELFLHVPPGSERQAHLLFLFTVAAFLLSEIKTPFDVSTFCRNRFDLRYAVTTGEILLRSLAVVVLFRLAAPQMWQVGAGILLAAIFSAVNGVRLWRLLTPTLRVRASQFDWPVLRDLTGTGGWIIVNQIGTILFLSIDLLVVNHLFGPRAGGRYAAVMQWSLLLRAMAGAIAAVFTPTVMTLFAKDDSAGLIRYSRQSVKLTGLLMALPIGLVCGLSRPLLLLWLGPGFVPLAPLMSLMTIHLCINLGYLPLQCIGMATNRVKLPGLVQVGLGAVNLALALFLAGPCHWGLYGIAAAGAIVLTTKNAVFTPLYSAHVIHAPAATFLREIMPISAVTLLIVGLGQALSLVWHVHRFAELLAAGALISAIYLAAAYFLLLSVSERRSVAGMIPGRRKTNARKA